MSDARQQLNEMRNLRQRMEDIAGDAITEAATRKDFRMVADLISKIEDPELRRSSAEDHAKMFALQNPRFRRDLFMAAAGVDEALGENEFDDVEGKEFVDTIQSQLTDNDPCMYCDGEDPACEVCSDPGNMYEEGDYRDEPNRPGWKDIEGNWNKYEDCPTCHGWGEYLPHDVEQDMDNVVPCPDCGPETEFGPAARAKTKDIKDYADSMDMDYTDLPLVKEGPDDDDDYYDDLADEADAAFDADSDWDDYDDDDCQPDGYRVIDEDDGYRECDSCRGAGCQACHDHGYVEDEEQLDEGPSYEEHGYGGVNLEKQAMSALARIWKARKNRGLEHKAIRAIADMIRIGNKEAAANLFDDKLGDEFIEIVWTFNDNNEGEALLRYLADANSWAAQSALDGLEGQPELKLGEGIFDLHDSIQLDSIVDSVLEDFPGQPKDYEMSNDELAADIEDSTSEFERDTIDPEIEDEELGLRFD